MTKTKQEYKGIARTLEKQEREEIPEEQLDDVFFQNMDVKQTHNRIRQMVRDLTPGYDVLFVQVTPIEEEEDTSDDPPFDPEWEDEW